MKPSLLLCPPFFNLRGPDPSDSCRTSWGKQEVKEVQISGYLKNYTSLVWWKILLRSDSLSEISISAVSLEWKGGGYKSYTKRKEDLITGLKVDSSNIESSEWMVEVYELSKGCRT